MYLKQLEIIGFKSFAERTRLNFEPGITSIVGPNGCGKTNVVDSIKWVLGEQSAKSLRGNRMEEVIFHGTDERKGIGMAEVSVTFDNSKKLLPLEFGEVTIARRVFRSGESQYFINKNLCRLKDIDNLFMDTGVGMRAYSVFEQGKMDLILSARPEERRVVFEEAAGITKYKEQKREALHKLEITENNLIRLNDIIKEVQRQINSIERQAAKARRYKKLADELKEQEVKSLVFQLRDLQKKSEEFEKDKTLTENEAINLRGIINAKENKFTEMRKMMNQLAQEMASVQDEKLLVETRLVSNKQNIQYNQNKILDLVKKEETINVELKRLDEEIGSLRGTLEGLVKELSGSKDTKGDFKNKLDEKYNIVKSHNAKQEELTNGLSSKKDLLIGKTSQESHIKNNIYNIDIELKGLALKERRDFVEISKKKKNSEKLLQEINKAEGVLELQKTSLFNLRQVIKDAEEKIAVLKDETGELARKLKDKQQYFTEKRSEYEIFSNQKRQFEGYIEGVRVVLENKDEFPGVIGIVNDLITIPQEYVKAISSRLGSKVQWIVVDDLINAYTAAKKLNARNVYRTVFIVLELLPDLEIAEEVKVRSSGSTLAHGTEPRASTAEVALNSVEDCKKPVSPGMPGALAAVKEGVRAIDVVTYEKQYEKLVKFLLGRAIIIDELNDDLISAMEFQKEIPTTENRARVIAKQFSSNLKDKEVLVTKNGMVIDPDGIVSGGRTNNSSYNLVSRETEINELKNILKNKEAEILVLTEKHGQSETRLIQEERQLESAKNNLYNEEISFSVQESDFLRLKTNCEAINEEIKVLELDNGECITQKEQLNKTRLEKERELSFSSLEISTISREIDGVSELLQELNEQKEKEERDYTELKITLVGLEEKENLLEFKKAEREKQIDTTVSAMNRLSSEKTEDKDIVEKLLKDIAELELETEKFSGESINVSRRYDSARTKRQEIETELAEGEEILRKERQECDGVNSELNKRQLRLSEMKLKTDNITQRLQDEYKIADEAVNSILLEGISIDVLEQEVVTLKEKLDAMGEVSLAAINEQDELVKRFEFLSTQRDDLVNAKESLLKAIAKLNVTTKKLFWDTFVEIRENFNKIFCQLFGGGKADLILIDESDILESGIEIIARPPGKKLQNVSLLSGGEKALTAASLLFSIFKTKPSPFCIMDEIDAPLDDSNIERFIQLLKEFAQQSQFLIVTHNKRTISAADALYGITMQESGISKVVSVKFTPPPSLTLAGKG